MRRLITIIKISSKRILIIPSRDDESGPRLAAMIHKQARNVKILLYVNGKNRTTSRESERQTCLLHSESVGTIFTDPFNVAIFVEKTDTKETRHILDNDQALTL